MRRVLICLVLVLRGFAQKYNYAPMVLNNSEEKKIVVCITACNDEKYVQRNLDSVFKQDYENYRVIYVDDASTDDTFLRVSEYIKNNSFKDKVNIYRNVKTYGTMCNLFSMIHTCDGDEIVLMLSGNDWLATNSMFQRINQAYLDSSVWATYGSYQTYPEGLIYLGEVIRSEVLQKRRHRGLPFTRHQIHTCYVSLFKEIPEKSFLDKKGDFYSQAWGLAFIINMIDVAGEHVYCIPEVGYNFNTETLFERGKLAINEQTNQEKQIRRNPMLEKIEKLEL